MTEPMSDKRLEECTAMSCQDTKWRIPKDPENPLAEIESIIKALQSGLSDTCQEIHRLRQALADLHEEMYDCIEAWDDVEDDDEY